MKIAIPTRNRVHDQQTLRSLPHAAHPDTFVFCPASEAETLRGLWPDVRVVVQPDPDMTIGWKRHWILNYMGSLDDKVLMLDDDLFFYKRWYPEPSKPRLLDSDADTTLTFFHLLSEQLSPAVPHGGFGPRQGNQNFPDGWQEGGRMMLALGYHIPTVLANTIPGRVGVREDMDICLQLLRKGLPNRITHEFAVGQKTFGAPGGMTGERTLEMSDAEAHRLADLHPGFVRVVEKGYNTNARKEVIVQWKAALAAGRARPQ